MDELQRHRMVFKVVLPFADLFAKWKFNFKYDSLKHIEGPYLLLSNHNLELDPALLGVVAGKQIYFVASEHVLRKGKLRGRLIHIYEPEQLAQMSDDQINDVIVADLHEDAYETQKKECVAFKGENLVLGLESTIFTCPKCAEVGTLHSQDNKFYCD